MLRTRLSSKGQVVLPKEICRARHWAPGTEFTIEAAEDGVMLRPAAPFKPSRIEDVAGFLRHRGRAKSFAEMDKAIDTELKARRARGRY
jgi:AbrB family looped-hinge helix DNA binding protein